MTQATGNLPLLSRLDQKLRWPWVAALAAGILFVRVPDLWLRPQFWAEDGALFFRDDYLLGWRAWLIPVGNEPAFLVIPQRLLAWSLGFFPPSFAPALYVYASFAIMLFTVALVASDRVQLPGRSLCALLIVLVPHSGEVFGAVCELQYFLPLGVVALFLMQPSRSRAVAWMEYAYVAALGVAGPMLALMAAPLLGFHLLVRRGQAAPARRRHSAFLVLIAATTSLQASVIWATYPQRGLPHLVVTREWITIPAIRVVGRLFAPRNLGSSPAPNFTTLFQELTHTPAFLIVAGLVLLAAAGVAGIVGVRMQAGRPERALMFLLLGCTLAGGFLGAQRLITSIQALVPMDNADRNFYVPNLMVLWFLLTYVRGARIGTVALGLVVYSIVLGASPFRISGFPRAPLVDYSWGREATRIGVEAVHIPINPPGWFVDLPARPKP